MTFQFSMILYLFQGIEIDNKNDTDDHISPK